LKAEVKYVHDPGSSSELGEFDWTLGSLSIEVTGVRRKKEGREG